jgi:predicted transcriptional regulator
MRKRILFEAVLAIAVIILFFIMYLMIVGNAQKIAVEWESSCNDTAYYTFTDDSGTLYAFMGSHIYAIDKGGSVKWNISIPDDYWMGSSLIKPAAASDDGILYVYLRPNMTKVCEERGLAYMFGGESSAGIFTDDMNRRVMDEYAGDPIADTFNESVIAISQTGGILWSLPLHSELYDPDIQARLGHVYVYHGYNETVIDGNGRVLWNLQNVGAAPAIDEYGNVYLVRATRTYISRLNDHRDPATTVEAYDPGGALRWSYPANESINVQNIRGIQSTVPIYHDHILYLALNNGVTALGTDGIVQWTTRFNGSIHFFKLMPFDSEGDIYVRVYPGMDYSALSGTLDPDTTPYDEMGIDDPLQGSYLAVLGTNGSEVAPRIADQSTFDQNVGAKYSSNVSYDDAYDGIAYSVKAVSTGDNRTMGDLETAILSAYDLKDGAKKLWSYQFPVSAQGTTRVTASDFKHLMYPKTVQQVIVMNGHAITSGSSEGWGSAMVSGESGVRMAFGKNATYAGFWTYNYEWPGIFEYSNLTYSGRLYSFDRNGNVMWSKPTSTLVTSLLESDGTIYYSMGNGSIQAAHADVVAGIAIAAAAFYLFIRFIVVGAVARARNKLDSNDNRNAVFNYITEHPGSTLYEVSRGIVVNIGTVRYHLFILGINHRIAVQKTGQKFVRYFPNSGTYSKDEQMIMSLLRREALRRVIETLMARPGLSNCELSHQLGLPESAMSKYMKELSSKGIIIKERASGGRLAYAIKDEYREKVAIAIKRIGD